MRRTEEELLTALTEVFRTHGFEGATLSRVSDATGLQRSSLYHRFPDGKQGMARAVLERTERRFAEEILAPLTDTDEPPRKRLERVVANLEAFYAHGTKACLLDTLSIGAAGGEAVQAVMKQTFLRWTEALRSIAREAGLGPKLSEQRAVDAVIRIEGALVVARVTDDQSAFQRTVAELPTFLTER